MDNQLRTPSPGRGSSLGRGSRTPSPSSPTSPSPPRTPSPPFKASTTKPIIRPHSSRPKKVVPGDNNIPVRHMPNLQRPWTAHVKSRSQKITRQSKKISQRTPARTDITSVKTDIPVSSREPKVQKFLLTTPYNEDSIDHTTLDNGVKTLMSGKSIYLS